MSTSKQQPIKTLEQYLADGTITFDGAPIPRDEPYIIAPGGSAFYHWAIDNMPGFKVLEQDVMRREWRAERSTGNNGEAVKNDAELRNERLTPQEYYSLYFNEPR